MDVIKIIVVKFKILKYYYNKLELKYIIKNNWKKLKKLVVVYLLIFNIYKY